MSPAGEAPLDASAATSLDGLFRPRSVAVIGASRTRGTIGRELLHNLISFEFEGMIFPVNPGAEVVHSMKCHRSVLSIPDEVDLAIVIVPRTEVLRVVDDCGRKGVKGVVVISSGFREVGEEGIERERRLVEICRGYGMRLIGPNCMGILNADPAYRLDATFAPVVPEHGSIGFLSQSGAMGVAILNRARALGLGLSMFASMGNKADVSSNDLLAYWEHHDDTRLILMYLEGFGNPRNFIPLARRITRKKPIIAVKSGRTQAGARAAASHTGAIAGTDVAVDALLDQCGVLRAESVEDLFDQALVFASQPLPAGRRIAILTDAGGPAIMATDALEAAGLELAVLSDETRDVLARGLSPDASVANPVDMLGHAGAREYAGCLELVLADEGVDAVVVLYVPPVMHDPEAVARSIRDARRGTDKPVVCVLMAPDDLLRRVQAELGAELPIYAFPEPAVRALGALVRYRELRDRPTTRPPEFDVDRDTVRRLIDEARAAGEEHLSLDQSQQVLAAYGIPFAAARLVKDGSELADAVEELGLPLVMKVSSPDIVHKSEVGGVVTGLRTLEEVRREYEALVARVDALDPPARLEGVVLQMQATDAREMIVGVSCDPVFGPLLMGGFGGVAVEVERDVSFRVLPIDEQHAVAMTDELRGRRLLDEFRGRPPAHLPAFHDALLRVAQLAQDFPEILEMELNPYMLAPDPERCMAVDARLRLA